MKKFSFLFVMGLMVLSTGYAFADLEWADPALCVAGKWLVISMANSDGIHVSVPHGVKYGNQAAGGCKTPAPAMLLPSSSVSVRGEDGLRVMIDGKQASAVVVVAYGEQSRTRTNEGGRMNFHFSLDAE